MKSPFEVKITDPRKALETSKLVRVGHYFLFVENEKALGKAALSPSAVRRARLLGESPPRQVIPLADEPIELAGLTLTPHDRSTEPLACVVTDRDLYRAEQDTVYLFTALPAPPEKLELVVECNGEAFTRRKLELRDGVGIECLSMLLPGSYSAQLQVAGRRIGSPASFTVAEYTLAPLTARLISRELHRDQDELSFELAVESYQVAFDGELEVALVEKGREISRTRLEASEPGRYQGRLAMRGEGPFRLRAISVQDAERVAEVAIPGSRAAEREASVVSELGKELFFSMMPEPHAMPLRGGYLTEGDVLTTPLVVDEVVADRWTLRVQQDVESLHLVSIDLATGNLTASEHGDRKAGEEVIVERRGPVSRVIAGCVVAGRPFEGYTTFFAPSRLEVELLAPETVRPREDLVVEVSARGVEGVVPVLLSVRDQRLTATDTPGVALGASAKRAMQSSTEEMAERSFVDLEELLPPGPTLFRLARARSMEPWANEVLFDLAPEATAAPVALSAAVGAAAEEHAGMVVLGEELGEDLEMADIPGKERVTETRSDFPEVLFYGVVPVKGVEKVVIPLGDALGTFAVEAFALAEGDWVEAKKNLVVDKPVRIDLEVPPSVQPGDKVTGRLRAVTASGKGVVSLSRDGTPVAMRARGADTTPVETPVELEFDVEPGTYRARVEDDSTGEVDSVEMTVTRPGSVRSYAKELRLLQAGEELTLDLADALTLRVLPAVEEPFDTLVTATAGYGHLCCEQTSAKILAATFMYLTAPAEGKRQKAEQIILAGIEREGKMLRPGRGFAMYPEDNNVIEYFSRRAVQNLWSLDRLEEAADLSPALRKAAQAGISLADTAAHAHRMERFPQQIGSPEDAYVLASSGHDRASVEKYLAGLLDGKGAEVRLTNGGDAVHERAALAYAAASFLAMGQLEKAIPIANQVTRQFNEQGRLYSTLDSVAAIALLIQLRISGLVTAKGRVRVNGKETTTLEAAAVGDQVESITVLDGVAAVEVTRIREEDWNRFGAAFPVRIGFRDARGQKVDRFHMGDKVELMISLPEGYRTGDLVHVSLPASLAWLEGGGKVKRFTLDFEGKDELRVSTVVTSRIEGEQHFALCVRNMFEEERASSPGLLAVRGAA